MSAYYLKNIKKMTYKTAFNAPQDSQSLDLMIAITHVTLYNLAPFALSKQSNLANPVFY